MTNLQTPTSTPTLPPETQLKFQCLDVALVQPTDVSNGLVILESRVSVDSGHYSPDAFMLNMVSRETLQIGSKEKYGFDFAVSPDRKLIAFRTAAYDAQSQKYGDETLVVENLAGEQLKSIPWEKGWVDLPGWLDNQHLAINEAGLDPDESHSRKAATLLVWNPFTGERLILHPDFPGLLNTAETSFPRWDGWQGIIYDPALSRAIYPSLVKGNDELYTYTLWDLSAKQPVVSLEHIFTNYSSYPDNFPMPRWAPDSSRFAFVGKVDSGKEYLEFELQSVSRDGQTEQLTHLNPWFYVGNYFSWSPDGRYIALYLNDWETEARVAVLDTVTHDITDYCVTVTTRGDGYGGPPPPPVWSPDSKQFLVTDWYANDHRRIILVDIAQGFAAQVAEDMEPVGWMVEP